MQMQSHACSLEAWADSFLSILPSRYTSWLSYFSDLSTTFTRKFTHLTSQYSDTSISSYRCSRAGLTTLYRDVSTLAEVWVLPTPHYLKLHAPFMDYLLRLYVSLNDFFFTLNLLVCKGFLPSIRSQSGRLYMSISISKARVSFTTTWFLVEFGIQ